MSLNVMRSDSKAEEILDQDTEHTVLLTLTCEEKTLDNNGDSIVDSIGDFFLINNNPERVTIVSRLEMPDKIIFAAVRSGLCGIRDHMGQTDRDTIVISRKQFGNRRAEAEFIATAKELFYNMDGMNLIITDVHVV